MWNTKRREILDEEGNRYFRPQRLASSVSSEQDWSVVDNIAHLSNDRAANESKAMDTSIAPARPIKEATVHRPDYQKLIESTQKSHRLI